MVSGIHYGSWRVSPDEEKKLQHVHLCPQWVWFRREVRFLSKGKCSSLGTDLDRQHQNDSHWDFFLWSELSSAQKCLSPMIMFCSCSVLESLGNSQSDLQSPFLLLCEPHCLSDHWLHWPHLPKQLNPEKKRNLTTKICVAGHAWSESSLCSG